MSKNIRLSISVGLIMIPALIFGYLDQIGVMSVVLIASVVSVALINIESFESFKVGKVFEAKMKEAKETIEEANATIQQLKNTSIPLMNYLLSHITWGHTVIGINPMEKEKLLEKLIDNYKYLNEYDKPTEKYIKEACKGILRDYFFNIRMLFDRYPYSSKDKDGENKKYYKIYKNLDYFEFEKVEILVDYLKSENVYSEETKERVDVYEKFKDKYSNYLE